MKCFPAFYLYFLECVICRSGFHKTGSVLWDITPTFTPLLLVSVRGSEMLHYHKNPAVPPVVWARFISLVDLRFLSARHDWNDIIVILARCSSKKLLTVQKPTRHLICTTTKTYVWNEVHSCEIEMFMFLPKSRYLLCWELFWDHVISYVLSSFAFFIIILIFFTQHKVEDWILKDDQYDYENVISTMMLVTENI